MAIQPKKDYYKILQVSPIASLETIQKSYRAASKKYHPDLNPGLKLLSEEKMQELVGAYEVLSDPEKRKQYDQQPHLQLRRSSRVPSSLPRKAYIHSTISKQEFGLKKLFQLLFKKAGPESTETSEGQESVHFTLGLSMADNEEFYDGAVEEFQKSLQYDPKFWEAYWNLGILCYRKGLFREAVINFKKVLALNPEDAMAQKMISLLGDDSA